MGRDARNSVRNARLSFRQPRLDFFEVLADGLPEFGSEIAV